MISCNSRCHQLCMLLSLNCNSFKFRKKVKWFSIFRPNKLIDYNKLNVKIRKNPQYKHLSLDENYFL